MNIYFKIKNQQIERLDNNKLVEKSREYVNAFFIFSEDWQNHKKTITFTSKENDMSYNVELVEDNCLIPWEVITPAGFTISGFGEGESFITLNKIEIEVEKSGLTEDGEVPGTPTPTQWELYKKEIEETINDLKENPVQGADGKSAYEVALDNGFEGTEEEWLESLKGEPGAQGLKGDKGEKGDTGAKGETGEDGVGIKEVTTAPSGDGVFTLIFLHMTDGNTYELYINNGANGEDGKDGADGVGIANVESIPFGDEYISLRITLTDGRETEFSIYNGKSAYQIATQNGFVGSEEEWIASLKGEKGDAFTFEDLTNEQKQELSKTLTVTDDDNGNVTIILE